MPHRTCFAELVKPILYWSNGLSCKVSLFQVENNLIIYMFYPFDDIELEEYRCKMFVLLTVQRDQKHASHCWFSNHWSLGRSGCWDTYSNTCIPLHTVLQKTFSSSKVCTWQPTIRTTYNKHTFCRHEYYCERILHQFCNS